MKIKFYPGKYFINANKFYWKPTQLDVISNNLKDLKYPCTITNVWRWLSFGWTITLSLCKVNNVIYSLEDSKKPCLGCVGRGNLEICRSLPSCVNLLYEFFKKEGMLPNDKYFWVWKKYKVIKE